ncbi:MAG: DUF2341 domain-containing protein, partial [Actinobacteria bacterium]
YSNAATWTYYTDWQRRAPVTVDNSSNAIALTGHQVKVSVAYDANMNADFSDVRFTDEDGDTRLDHWLESKTDSTSAVFWVKVPAIPGSSTKDIYIYYGNTEAASESDGEAVFLFFDDFNDNSLDTAKWQGNSRGSVVEQNGKLKFNSLFSGGGGLTSIPTFSRSNISLEYDFKYSLLNNAFGGPWFGWYDNSNYVFYTYRIYKWSSTYDFCGIYDKRYERKAFPDWNSCTIFDPNIQYKMRFRLKESIGNYFERSTDSGSSWITDYLSTYSSETNLRPGFKNGRGYAEFDNVRIRNWADPEPAVTIGNEERQVVEIVFADTDPYTTITLSPAHPDAYEGWYITLPAITLTSNKPGATYYQWDSKDGSWTTYGGSFNFPSSFDKAVDDSGLHTLYFYSESNGKTEDIRFFEFKVDSGYEMPNVVGGTCEDCHGEGSGLVGGDHVSWYNGTPHDLALNDDGSDGYAAVQPPGSSTKCQRCHYESMVGGPDGEPISERFLRITGANPDDPDGITDAAGVLHEVLGNDNTLCYACHTDGAGAYGGKTAFDQSMHSQNGSFASSKAVSRWSDNSYGQGECGNCHNPHGVEGTNDYRRKPKNQLCANCHDKTAPLTEVVSKDGIHRDEASGETDEIVEGPSMKTINLGKVGQDADLGDEDIFLSSNLFLEATQMLGIIEVYVNSAPNTTGATQLDSWMGATWEFESHKYYDITDWLNANKNADLYVVLVFPQDWVHTSVYIPSIMRADYSAVYSDVNPSGKKAYYAYQGTDKFSSSAHGDNSKPLTIWPNSADTGGSIGSGGATAGECINCHNPHGKEDAKGVVIPKLLQAEDEELCFTCHENPAASADGKNIRQKFNASSSVLSRHGVFDSDQQQTLNKIECSSCHNPHLNNAQNKVIDPDNPLSLFTQVMSDPVTGTDIFDSISYCVKCHNKDILLAEGVRGGWNAVYGYANYAYAHNNYSNNIRGKRAIKSIMKVSYGGNWHGDALAVGPYVPLTQLRDDTDGDGKPDTTRVIDRESDYGPLKAPYFRGMGPLPCTTCHDEHGSNQWFHLKEEINGKAVNIGSNGTNMMSLCTACHEDNSIVNAHEKTCYDGGSACHPKPNKGRPDFHDMPGNTFPWCIQCHNHEGIGFMVTGKL